MSAITRFLPRKSLSRLVGVIVHWRGPRWWAQLTIKAFAKYYKINLLEAEFPIQNYSSIGEFFVRKLKPEARPLGTAWAVHPADAVISQHGEIVNGTLIQAKSLTYNLDSFTADPLAKAKWDGGYFLTYYLCPTDYHRVHSPVSGKIISARLLRGDLWPVNEWSTSNIVNLFGINERVLVEIETELGAVGVVFVGATNVGSIQLSFTNQIQGNADSSSEHLQFDLAVSAGDELGCFRMGSTVVMLYPKAFKERFLQSGLQNSGAVKVNADLIK